jgi:hypothetical protein
MDNYLFGARGLSAASGKDVDFMIASLKDGRDVFFGFFALTPFLIAGTVVGFREFRRFTLAIAGAWLVTFVFGEKFADVPVQLPVYCLAAILAGIGLMRFARAGWLAIVLCLAAAVCVFGVVLFFPVPERIADHLPSTTLLLGFAAACLLSPVALKRPILLFAAAWLATGIFAYGRIADSARDADAYARMSKEAYSRAPANTLFVGEWNAVMRFNWNARRKTYTDDIALPDEKEKIARAEEAGRPIWSVRETGIGPASSR